MYYRKNEVIKIKYKENVMPIFENIKGDWIDLRASREYNLIKGDWGVIDLGVAIQLPAGYEAIIAPRSSTFKNYGIMTNSIVVIDECYSGDNDYWGFPFYVTRDTAIPKNARIAQFRIIEHQPYILFKEVNRLGNKDRGGFGSTEEI